MDGVPELTVDGTLVRVARLRKEFYEDLPDPANTISHLTTVRPKIDLFTFLQRFPDLTPRHDYPLEWDNVAAIPLTNYDHWWTVQASKNARKAVKKSERAGLITRTVALDAGLIVGIKSIFDETPTRQGKPFWHYQKSYKYVEEMLYRDNGKSTFIGTYLGDELVGFVKLLFGESWARSVQLLSKISHRNKSPNNALIAAAVRYSCNSKYRFLVYGQYEYGVKGSESLLDFKRHNGFVRLEVPRYYVPLTWKGRGALALRLHKGVVELLPHRFVRLILRARRAYYAKPSVSSRRNAVV